MHISITEIGVFHFCEKRKLCMIFPALSPGCDLRPENLSSYRQLRPSSAANLLLIPPTHKMVALAPLPLGVNAWHRLLWYALRAAN